MQFRKKLLETLVVDVVAVAPDDERLLAGSRGAFDLEEFLAKALHGFDLQPDEVIERLRQIDRHLLRLAGGAGADLHGVAVGRAEHVEIEQAALGLGIEHVAEQMLLVKIRMLIKRALLGIAPLQLQVVERVLVSLEREIFHDLPAGSRVCHRLAACRLSSRRKR